MSIEIQKVTSEEYIAAVQRSKKSLPIWLSFPFVDCYKEKDILIAKRGNDVVGFWIVPQIKNDDGLVAKRNIRFLPYSSPFIIDLDNIKKREVIKAFFMHIKNNYESISIPLDPNFKDIVPIQGLGMFVEYRHTHTMNHMTNPNDFGSRMRNNYNKSKKIVTLEINEKCDIYNYKKAIKGLPEEVELRSAFGEILLNNHKGITISGKVGDKIEGGLFIMYQGDKAYLLHSWRNAEAPRGIVGLMIVQIINWLFENHNIKFFDFEGSIIQTIDYFFCGFNADITPYPYVHWASSKKKLNELINSSININGRLY